MRCGHRHVRARRLAYFADGLCVATPVQSAAAASGRARRPPRPRQLRHDWQARRRRHGHEDLAAGTPAGSLPLGPCSAKPVPVKPVKPVSRARASSRLSGAIDALLDSSAAPSRRRLRPGHRRHMTVTASTTAASSGHDPPHALSFRPNGRRRLHAQTRPASAERVARISKAPAITERLQRSPRRHRRPLGGAGVPVSHMSLGCMAVRTMALPLRRRLSQRLNHITASPTTPARLTRVPLTCIYTAHTSHSRHRLPLAARIHSTSTPTPVPADTFLVPARSPRKTRPSRRPPRSARPLDRPTSFMRTTTPQSPPAKALSMMSRLRCAQSQHECEPGGISPQVLVAKGTRVATAP